ncbi:MAG TPA: hypothetical protein VJ817_04720, partial [Gemmatimonadales bacterium]|nr:hypothetical protein [Gemmatimonadales bacterium]
AAVGILAAGALAVYAISGGRETPPEASVALRDRTQLTFTGAVSAPALSADGKQLAYFVKVCGEAGCTSAIDVQDVGSTASRRILEGATAGYALEWSPDRRNLIMAGTVRGRYGSHLVPVLGGASRHLTPGAATFFAGGDSLLIGSSGTDSFTVRVASLSGAVRDSIRIPGPGNALGALAVMPGTSRIIALVIQAPRGLWQIVERSGKVTDKLLNTCTCGAAASRDAIWMTRAGPTAAEAVVRVAIDPATGRFSSRQDTVYNGQFSGLSVTADGTQMAVDDGSYSFTVLALGVPELLRGKLPPGPPLMQASSQVSASISPDGGRLLLRRVVPNATGQQEQRLTVAPYPGGTEAPVNIAGQIVSALWTDSVTIAVGTYTTTGLRLAQVDVRTGSARNTMELPDSTLTFAYPLPAGWAWIPRTQDRIVVASGADRREIPKPAWFSALHQLGVSPDGTRLLVLGWNAATEDSIGVEVIPVAGGPSTPWYRSFAEGAFGDWLGDGSILVSVWSGEQSVSLFRVRGPSQVEPLGGIPHAVNRLTVSSDLKRATLAWRDYRGDAWLYRVVAP